MDTEYIILLVFLSFAVYVFVEAGEYSWRANVFPKMTSAVVIVGTVLLLVRDYLPGPLRRIVAESTDLTEQLASEGPENPGEESNQPRMEDTDQQSLTETLVPNTFVTGTLVLFFVVSGYLIGLLWTTPLFIGAYTLWFGLRWYYVVVLSLAGFGIAYTFNSLLVLSLDEGLLTEAVMYLG